FASKEGRPVKARGRSVLAISIPALALGLAALAFGDDAFNDLVRRLGSEKAKFAERQQSMLSERYDLGDHPVSGAKMTRGKPVQGGVRVKLAQGMTWARLATMTPDDI